MGSPRRILCSKPLTASRTPEFSEEESHHASVVLRLEVGEVLEVLDGVGGSAMGVLASKRGSRIQVDLTSDVHSTTKAEDQILPLTLATGIIKGEAMEWMIEKVTELGVDQLIPLELEYSVVRMKGRGENHFQTRWQRIADQALKQSGRKHRMEVHPPCALSELVMAHSHGHWCDESGTGNRLPQLGGSATRSELICIGAEGGWSPLERELLTRSQSWIPVSLGPRILRAETAAVFAASSALLDKIR